MNEETQHLRIDLNINLNLNSPKLQLVLDQVLSKLGVIMAGINDLATEVAAEGTLIDGVSTLVSGLQKQLADALSGANLPPDVQKQVDAVFANVEANKLKLTQALTANTPAAATPVGGAVANSAAPTGVAQPQS